ncbi:MAG: competence/damage-inducible protein A [Spirochaetes bacterium]|nr:MAG: competence/damage-inducible protein A [Spirochaetota bacterium]
MNAFLINIGDELTKGEICNTNASYIAQKLTQLGIEVRYILTLPDNLDISKSIIEKNIDRAGIYIFTGGLGGTRDDITRKIIEKSIGISLIVSKEHEKKLEKWYKKRQRGFTDADRSQALYPEGGRILNNNVGLAYGFYIETNNRHIFSLPGVPSEMMDMFDNEVLPILKEKNLFDSAYNIEFLKFSGIPEYTLDREISKIMKNYPDINYGTRSNNGIIRIRLDSKKTNLDKCVDEIKEKLSDNLICIGNYSLEEVAGKLLKERGFTIAVSESCTAGYLAKTITNVSGSSDYFIGGVVSYSNQVKNEVLGVKTSTLEKYGAVSSQTAKEMAKGVKNKLKSDIGLSTTGIAGPTGGTSDKPVGTVYIGWALPDGQYGAIKNYFKGDRETVRIRTVNNALFQLIKILREIG